MFAYSIQPILFLVAMVYRITAALVCLMVGCKGIGWKPIFNPLNFSSSNVTDDIKGSYFEIPWLIKPFRYVFLPTIPMGLLGWLVLSSHNVSLWFIPIFAFGLPFVLFFALGIVFCAERLSNLFVSTDSSKIEAKKEAKRLALLEWERQQRELMVCSNTMVIRKLSDLPKSKRTFKLRFLGVKSMVCRPFAK